MVETTRPATPCSGFPPVHPPIMRCVSSIGLRFLAVVLAAGGLTVSLRGEYKEPDFGREIFDMSGVVLGESERVETANALAALAGNFHDDDTVGAELREMALAVGLRIEPANRAATSVHRSLFEGTLPTPVKGFLTKEAIAAQLWKTAAVLDDVDSGEDERALRCYLLDIARRLDPDNAAGHANFQKAAARGPFPGWKGILGRETEDTFVFPEEGTKPPVPSNPSTPATTNQGALKGTSATMLYPALARSEAGGTGSRLVGIFLTVNSEKSEPGQPIRILYPSAVENETHPLSVTAATLVTALRTLHPDWPANGSKIVARFDAPYTETDGRAGELPVALGVHSLYSGETIPSGTAALGGVEVDGSISPVVDFLPRLVRLSAANCDTVIVPAANSTALLDLLVTGDVTPLLRYQVFTVVTLKEAIPLIGATLSASLQKARLDFEEVRDVALKSSSPGDVIRTEAVRERLRGILKLAPGHASAQLLLRFALGDVPEKLSPAGSRVEIATLIAAYRPFMEAAGDLLVTGDAEQLRGKTTAALTTVRNKLDPEAIPLADALGDFARAFEEYGKVKFKGSQLGRTMKDALVSQWQGILGQLAESKPGAKPVFAPAATRIDFGLDDDQLPR
jgi:hypothetical protein